MIVRIEPRAARSSKPSPHWLVRRCPWLGALVLAELFVAPRRRSAAIAAPEGATTRELRVGARRVRVHLVGEGPLVVLVHDWQGSGAQLLGLARGLAKAGFRVACFDMPAHGGAPGLTTSLSEFTSIIAELERRLGPVHAFIGHGLGGLSALLVGARSAAAAALVAIAPLPSFEFAVERFSRSYGLGRGNTERLIQRLERRLKLRRDDAALPELSPAVPTLLVHDVLDRKVSIRHSRRLSSGWRHARLMETCGLGHDRIVSAPAVIHFIGNFLRDIPPRRAAQQAKPSPELHA